MVTVLRQGGFSVVIYLDDHPPAHVHVIKDGHAKINLIGTDGLPELVKADGMTRADVRKAFGIVVEQQDYLIARWNEIHG
jgi:hypothetical protein